MRVRYLTTRIREMRVRVVLGRPFRLSNGTFWVQVRSGRSSALPAGSGMHFIIVCVRIRATDEGPLVRGHVEVADEGPLVASEPRVFVFHVAFSLAKAKIELLQVPEAENSVDNGSFQVPEAGNSVDNGSFQVPEAESSVVIRSSQVHSQ